MEHLVTNGCRFGDNCHTEGCRFNHPSRLRCRDDFGCGRNDCYFNHTAMLCQFDQGCAKRGGTCPYRHTHTGVPTAGTGIHGLRSASAVVSTRNNVQVGQTTLPVQPSFGTFGGNLPTNSAITGPIQFTAGITSITPASVNLNVCRFGEHCHAKRCRFDHPGLPTCRDDSNCARIDCHFNHTIMLCQFDQACTKKTTGTCHFRHTCAQSLQGARQPAVTMNSSTRPEEAGVPKRKGVIGLPPGNGENLLEHEFEEDTIDIATEESGATRALIGTGYQVKEILFPGEFATLHIPKLSISCTKEEVMKFLASAGHGQWRHGLVSTNIMQHRTAATATLKFQDKQHAKQALEKLKGQLFQGNPIHIGPLELAVTTSPSLRQSETCRLTVSWATSPSVGKAIITFQTPSDANHVIENVETLFRGARTTRIHGELKPTATSNLAKIPHLKIASVKPKVIIFATHQPWPLDESSPGFAVTLVHLKRNVDEFAIRQVLARVPILPTRITVTRAAATTEKMTQEDKMLQREVFLDPLRPFITESTITTDFVHKSRAGVHILLEDAKDVPATYLGAQSTYARMKWFNGQPVRLEREYTKWSSIHRDMYKFFRADIEKVNQYARQRGMTTSDPSKLIKEGSKFVSFSYRGPNKKLLAIIQTRLDSLEQAIEYRAFNHRDRDLLFTWTGRKIMEKLSVRDKAFIHCDTKTRTLLIYGQQSGQDFVQEQLVAIIEHIKKYEEVDKLWVLSARHETDLSKVVGRAVLICQSHGAAYWHIVKNRLYVTGSTDVCKRIEAELLREQLLRPFGIKTDSSKGECGLCFCDLATSFLTTSICSHSFCTECLEPMFETVPPPLPPIKCPQAGCGKNLPVQDITKFASAEATRTLLDYAVGAYRTANPQLVTMCPKPGCNQLLPTPTTSQKGTTLHCFACQVTYCLACTEQAGKAMEVHPGESCAQNQRGVSSATLGHLKHIRENILNHKCPRCSLVVWEFDGCCAVTCSCQCAFCGICFQDCGIDAHPHVTRCPSNPQPGQMYVGAADLNRVHNTLRVVALRDYITKSVCDSEVSEDVRKYLSKDLTELGINPTEIFGA